MLTSSLQEGALVCLVPHSQSSGPPCSMGYVAVCVLLVCVCVCAHECSCLQRPAEGSRLLDIITGICKPPDGGNSN